MIKQNPSIGRMIAMAGFTLSVFAILIFLWLAFGGSVPLKPESYRFTVHMPHTSVTGMSRSWRRSWIEPITAALRSRSVKGMSRWKASIPTRDQ